MRIMLLPLMLMACGDKTEDSAAAETAVEEQEQAASEEQAQQSEEDPSEQAEETFKGVYLWVRY